MWEFGGCNENFEISGIGDATGGPGRRPSRGEGVKRKRGRGFGSAFATRPWACPLISHL